MDSWLEHNRQTLLAVLLVLFAVGVGALVWRWPGSSPPVLVEPALGAGRGQIKAYITGEVRQPGVYTLSAGDRVEEALKAAGGPTSDADLEACNLSRRVRDEDHIQVPRRVGSGLSSSASAELAGKQTLLDLNTATGPQLEALPGIGPVTAGKILQHREKSGPFGSASDLLDLKLVNRSTFDKISSLVTVR